MTNPVTVQRIGGAATYLAGTVIWFSSGFGWLPYVLLLFAFDLCMLGYLAGPRTGAVAYNLGHGALLPSLVVVAYVLTGADWLLPLACLWFAHIGIDYALGYGLKTAESFQATHLGEIGRKPRG